MMENAKRFLKSSAEPNFKEPVQTSQVPFQAIPQQVWMTLTEKQRQMVLQTLVRICQTLLNQSGKERQHEPAPDC